LLFNIRVYFSNVVFSKIPSYGGREQLPAFLPFHANGNQSTAVEAVTSQVIVDSETAVSQPRLPESNSLRAPHEALLLHI
jgi:hypothetical protein